MKNIKNTLLLIIFFAALITGACNFTQPAVVETDDTALDSLNATATPDAVPATEEIQLTAAPAEITLEPTSKRYFFDQLGISLEVPSELYVRKDPGVNYEDASKLDVYLFYIQNYGHPGGLGSGDFQIYGHTQFDLPPISWEEFKNNTINSPMNAYANEIEINGVRGFDTQLSGTRNRYVYQFYLNGHIFSIAVSDPTEENKAKADQIISTMIFNPDEFTTASKVQLIIEPNFYYRMYLPDDWNYSFNPTAGVRLSDLEASSPDAEVLVEEVDGPHSNIFYKNGVVMNFVILEDDSAKSEPNSALIHNKYTRYVYGFEGTEYSFIEPSTAEGELREVRFYQNGISYLLRFGFPENADRELIEWIIMSLQFAD